MKNQLKDIFELDKENVENVLLTALNALPQIQREVIILTYFSEKNDGEIAHILNKTSNAILILRHRGLRNLKRYFQKNNILLELKKTELLEDIELSSFESTKDGVDNLLLLLEKLYQGYSESILLEFEEQRQDAYESQGQWGVMTCWLSFLFDVVKCALAKRLNIKLFLRWFE